MGRAKNRTTAWGAAKKTIGLKLLIVTTQGCGQGELLARIIITKLILQLVFYVL
jgi:hypothetical protein